MATSSKRSALERLKAYYDDRERVCTACGFVDDETNWAGATNGRVVEYSHECPCCRAVMEHTVDLRSA
jgi:transposase